MNHYSPLTPFEVIFHEWQCIDKCASGRVLMCLESKPDSNKGFARGIRWQGLVRKVFPIRWTYRIRRVLS